ncbi:MAG: DUF1446 domain-containing protein [Elioraea sp.]|nr:DUF1446 domain-containing protein [Elioraea sp.]
MAETYRIGCGAGFSADRIDPAVTLIERARPQAVVFECLAERTVAQAVLARLADPEAGFDPWFEDRMRAVLPPALAAGTALITNMGAANPAAAGRLARRLAAEAGAPDLPIAVVEGDEVTETVRHLDPPFLDRPGRPSDLGEALVSAHAYLGAAPIVQALAGGARLVITGRVADPALFLGPLIARFGWAADDWERLGRGILIGHLLECAGQLTGGYFADPGVKDVAGLADLGLPFADVQADGNATLSKPEGTGGRLDRLTCTEQLLYELHDPGTYLQPDATADFRAVRFTELGPDRVRVEGGTGRAPPPTLKVMVGYRDGVVVEGGISYAGDGAVARARLALEVLRERLGRRGIAVSDLRTDIIGVDSVLRGAVVDPDPPVRDVRARLAARVADHAAARAIGHEIEALWLNGPAGGGGASWSAREGLAVASVLIPRDLVCPTVSFVPPA